MDPSDALVETLRLVGARLDAAPCSWVVIASAAVALYTGDAQGVGDVDILVDEADAAAAFAALGLPLEPGLGTDLFRSRYFGRWDGGPLTVELFAGFELSENGSWREVRVTTRQLAEIGGVRAFVPAIGELAAMLRSFGREKDLARAELLSASGPFPSRPGSA